MRWRGARVLPCGFLRVTIPTNKGWLTYFGVAANPRGLLVGQVASYQPIQPHWFLPLLGVDPISRGQGHGSAMLLHLVARFDRDWQLAYLDSTNSRNVPLYERHGFERLGAINAGSCSPVYPMLRRSR
jgi:ribosomal protein S18 acetylase RimI-like enzyme